MNRHDGPTGALGAFVVRYLQLIDERGTNFTRLAVATKYSRAYCSAAAKGREVPAEALVVELDAALRAGGELLALRASAADERAARRHRRAVPKVPEQFEGVDETDRRELFELGAAGLLAANTYRERSRTGPDPLTLVELEDAVVEHAAALTTTPHDELAAKVYRTWRSAETLIETGARAKAQVRLTTVAGYASYTMGRLAFNLGNATASRRFATLASVYADEIDDPVLMGSVSALASTLAFYSGRWGEAVDEARHGVLAAGGHSYVHARLAGYEARALAARGDEAGARGALAVMRSVAADVPARPGNSPFGPAAADMFTGGVLARIGAGDEGELSARAAVEAFELGRAVGFEEHGHALLALASALVSRPKPVPDEAAALTSRVVDMLDERPTSSVASKVGDVFDGLRPFAALAPVRDLREQLAERPRLALTAGGS